MIWALSCKLFKINWIFPCVVKAPINHRSCPELYDEYLVGLRPLPWDLIQHQFSLLLVIHANLTQPGVLARLFAHDWTDVSLGLPRSQFPGSSTKVELTQFQQTPDEILILGIINLKSFARSSGEDAEIIPRPLLLELISLSSKWLNISVLTYQR
jgi:hypothetical protein